VIYSRLVAYFRVVTAINGDSDSPPDIFLSTFPFTDIYGKVDDQADLKISYLSAHVTSVPDTVNVKVAYNSAYAMFVLPSSRAKCTFPHAFIAFSMVRS